jgi:NADPH:quinone reductase-like Zn-dependent oxidoreductase
VTDEEFHSRYRQEFNLATQITQDIWEAFGRSLGLTRAPNESYEEFFDRMADFIESRKARPAVGAGTRIGTAGLQTEQEQEE